MTRRDTAVRGTKETTRSRSRPPRQRDAARDEEAHDETDDYEDTDRVRPVEPASDVEYEEDDYPEAEESDDDGRKDGPGVDEERQSRSRAPMAGAVATAGQAAQAALQQIVELTGKSPEGITAVAPGEDGWVVGVEVVEDRRVPSSADILAIYEAAVDPDGSLMSYRRVKRYSRGRGDDGDMA